ncbi:MAG: cyclic nucleotide-binding domain-containing protein [Victivallaceae bacterium]
MEQIKAIGNDIPLFSELTEIELKLVSDASTRIELKTGETVFKEGDSSGGLLVIVDGKVRISTRIVGDVERTLLTLSRGGVFGELSVITGDVRTAGAVAVADTVLLSLERDRFSKLTTDNPELGRKLLFSLLNTVCGRLNTTTELYRQAAAWGLNISGAVEMDYNRLIVDSMGLTVELLTGKKLTGMLLKVDRSDHGRELMIKTDDERIVVVPFHAVAEISFPAGQLTRKQNN